MNFCPACHNQYEADKKYCRRCGIPLVAEDSLSPEIRAKILIFENRLAKEPENLNHLLEYGKFLSSVSLYAEAQVQLLRGLEIDPAHERLRRELIRVYKARQDFDLVATHLLVLLEAHPDDFSLLENLAEIYQAGGRLAEAAEVLARISERQPGNIQILTDRLKLLQQLGRQQEIIEVCQKLASIAPKDIAPWEFMAQQWLSLGQKKEAITAFEAILKLEPDHPVANYHVGVDRYNLAIQEGEAIHFREAGGLLKKALNGAARLLHEEVDLAKLYYCNSRIHCNEVLPDLLEVLTSIAPHNLQPDGQRLLEECLLSLGNYFEQAGNPQHAMACYEALLKYKDNPQAQERLAVIHVRAGDLFLASGKVALARREYEKACCYQPNDPEIQEKRRAAVSQERRKTYIIGAIGLGVALVLLVVGLLFYLGQGSLSIRTNTWASISVSRGGEVVASTSGDYLQTPQLRYGSYELLIQKPGYRPVKQVLQVGFSRKPQEVKIDLKPVFGKLKISSEPPGAKVTVRNQYQTKSGTTPCELDGIHAMPAHIEMAIPEYLPYQITKEIPIDQVLDLGTIIFKGSLVVESNPSEAEVWVDGVLKGTTPFKDDKLPAKVTKLEVRKTGVGAYLAEVPIEPGKTINLGIISIADFGILKVKSRPQKARISIDGKDIGATPIIHNLRAGDYTLRVENPGYAVFEKRIVIKSGEVLEMGTISLVSVWAQAGWGGQKGDLSPQFVTPPPGPAGKTLPPLSPEEKLPVPKEQEILAEKIFEEGRKLYKQDNFSEALVKFQESVRLNPQRAWTHYMLAFTYDHTGNNLEAIESFKQAIRLKEDYALAYSGLAWTYNKLGQHNEAIDASKKALNILPKFIEAHYNLGMAYVGIGDFNLAAKQYNILNKMDNKHATMLYNNIQERFKSESSSLFPPLENKLKSKKTPVKTYERETTRDFKPIFKRPEKKGPPTPSPSRAIIPPPKEW